MNKNQTIVNDKTNHYYYVYITNYMNSNTFYFA